MKNTERLFEALKAYQDKRAGILKAYNDYAEKLKKAKGSTYYTEQMKKAIQERDSALKRAQAETGEKVDSIFNDMTVTNNSRTMKAPTDEQLKILSALKMRDNVTETELTTAANACKDTPAALAIVQEIANKNAIPRNFLGDNGEMTINRAQSLINDLKRDTRDFLEHETTPAARLYAKHESDLYGVNTTPTTRPTFDTINGCYKTVANMSSNDVKALSGVVDTAED